jgi:hypothetical protein
MKYEPTVEPTALQSLIWFQLSQTGRILSNAEQHLSASAFAELLETHNISKEIAALTICLFREVREWVQ